MIDKLTQLAERAPDICRPYGDAFDIGPYRFRFLNDGTLEATTGRATEEGRPAEAWLRDALEQAIEARGRYWSTDNTALGNDATIYFDEISINARCEAVSKPTPAAALLDALLAAVEA